MSAWLNHSSRLFKALTAVFGVLPGVSVLLAGLGVPPGKGLKLVFAGTVEALGVLCLLLIYFNRSSILKYRRRVLTYSSVALGFVGFVCIVLYILLFSHAVVSSDMRGSVYLPLWDSGPLKELVAVEGSREAVLEKYGRYALYEISLRVSSLARHLSTAILLTVYQMIFTAFTLAFGLPATVVNRRNHSEPNQPESDLVPGALTAGSSG